MEFFVVGAVPPPHGGVASFCDRRVKKMASSGKTVRFYQAGSCLALLNLFFKISFLRVKKIKFTIELNSSHPFFIMFVLFCLPLRRCIFLDHNSSRRFTRGWKMLIFRLFCNRVARVCICNAELRNVYHRQGFRLRKAPLLFVPFVPPSLEELAGAQRKAMLEFEWFGDISEQRIVLFSAWRLLGRDIQDDLYGASYFLRLVEEFHGLLPDFQFVFQLGSLCGSEWEAETIRNLRRLKNVPNFFFVCGEYSSLPFVNRARLVCRFTQTDGDSVLVREALYLGSRVLASNVVSRPTGCKTCELNYGAIKDAFEVEFKRHITRENC